MVSFKSLLIVFVMLLLVSSAVSAAPSLTNVVINTTSGGFFGDEDINLTFTSDASTYSVNWKTEGSSIYDMYIPFDTTTVKDVTGNTLPVNHGATFNSTYSKYGGSYYFNGSNYIDTGKSGYTNFLTTCVWADINYSQPTSTFIGNWHDGSGIAADDSWILFYQSNMLKLYVVNTSGGYKSIVYDTGIIDGWHYFCLRYNETYVSLHMDGDEKVFETHNLGSLKQTGKNITIGVLDQSDPLLFTKGFIDEVFTVGEFLSNAQINAIYESSPDYINNGLFSIGDNVSAEVIAYDSIGGETIIESNTEQIQEFLNMELSMENESIVNIKLPVIINVTTNDEVLCKFAYEEFDFDTEGIDIGNELIHQATISINQDEIKTVYFKCKKEDTVKNKSITIKGVNGAFNDIIVTMGDSIFWDETQSYRHMTQVRDRLRLSDSRFWNIDEINSAINAGCMSNLTSVCESPTPTVEMYQTTVIDNNPRYILWETIVNDALRQTSNQVSKDDYQEVYNGIADDIRTQLPDLQYMILTTPAPTSYAIGNGLSDYSDVAREYAILHEYPFFELTYVVDWNQTYIKDYIHFNQLGHDLMADKIVDIFENPEDYIMTTSDWNYYKYCGLTEGIILDYNFSSPLMNCYGNDGGWPAGVQDWLIIKNIKKSGFIIERADENFSMTTSTRYDSNTEYDVVIGGVESVMTTTSDGRLTFEFESQTNTIVSISEINVAMEDGINGVKIAVFAGFGLIAVALLASIAFLITKMFNNGADMASLTTISIMAIGLTIVLFVGYIIISAVANGLI